MEITDVRIRRMEDEGKMKAVASVTFDGEFVVHDIKIVKGLNGLFVAMPSKKIGDKYKDVAHPLLPETRENRENLSRDIEYIRKSQVEILELKKYILNF